MSNIRISGSRIVRESLRQLSQEFPVIVERAMKQAFKERGYGDRPLKVHFYRDQKGASYRSMGKDRLYANTACKHNWPVENITENRSQVTCSRCLKMMDRERREAVANDTQPSPDMESDYRDLEEWLEAERLMADKMGRLARWLLDQMPGDHIHVLVVPDLQLSVGEIALGQLARFDEHTDSRKGRWNEPPL